MGARSPGFPLSLHENIYYSLCKHCHFTPTHFSFLKGLAAPGGAVPEAVVATVYTEAAGRVGRLSGQKFRSMPGATPAGYGMETP